MDVRGAVCGKAWSVVTMLLTPYAAAPLSGPGGLAALTSAFDLAVHPVNLGQHVFGLRLHFQVG